MSKDYRDYWNDIEKEKEKDFYITGPDDMKALRYIREKTSIEKCFLSAVGYVNDKLGGVGADVLDVAAGVCWTSAIVSREPGVKSVVAVDYSSHRIMQLAPYMIEQLGGRDEKISRRVGDFMNMELGADCWDTIIFTQALYMFDDLDATMKRVCSLLKRGGKLIIACERTNAGSFLSAEFARLIFSNSKYAAWFALVSLGLRSDTDSTGRHLYKDCHYKNAMQKAGLRFYFQPLDYPLWKGLPVNTGNYFGVKV